MGMKKVLVDIAIIALAFFLFVVWHQKNVQPSMQAMNNKRNRDIDIFLITADKENQDWRSLYQGALDMAILMGANLFWEVPDDRSAEEQSELINRAVDRGVEAILVAAKEPALISTAIEDAIAKGVKIIYVDSPPSKGAITTLATDQYKAGEKAGQIMITILEERGKLKGSVGIINIVEEANAKLREEGFRITLERDGRFKLLDTVYVEGGNPDAAQRAAEQLILEHEDLVALFGTCGGASIGIGNAIKASDNRYVGVGFGKNDTILRLLRDQNLNAIIDENPYTMGYLGLAEAVAAVKGDDTGPSYIDTGVSVLVNY